MRVYALFYLFSKNFDSIFVVVEVISHCVTANLSCGSVAEYFCVDEVAFRIFTQFLEVFCDYFMAVLQWW